MNRRVITIFIALVAFLAGADTFKSFVFYKNGERVVTVPVADVDSMVFVRPETTPDEPDTPPVNPDSPQDTVPEIPETLEGPSLLPLDEVFVAELTSP